MKRLAQLLTAVALLSIALLAWPDGHHAIFWPRLLPPILLALGQLAWFCDRHWLSRALLGVALGVALALLASFLVPESWIGFDTWSAWFSQWAGADLLTTQRPPLLWLITLVLLSINGLLRLRLGLGAPALLTMTVMLLVIQGVTRWQIPSIEFFQAYAALPYEQVTLWLLCLAQLAILARPLHQHRSRVLVPLVIGGGVTLVTVLWWQQLQTQADRQLYHVSEREGQRLASRLNREIDNQLDAMRRFVSFWELFDRAPSEAHWRRQVARYQDDYRYFQDIGFITPDGVIRWVYPLNANRRIVGTRLFEAQPEGQAALHQALVERREGQVGVVELLQGGKGMIYYLPIVAESNDRLLGAASMVISLEMLIEVLLEQVNIDHIALTLGEGGNQLVRAGPLAHLAEWSHRHVIDVGERTLTLTTRPSRAFLLQSRARLPELTLTFGLMLAYLLYQLLYAQRRLGHQNEATQQANADLHIEIATRIRLQQEVEWMARHDELTALPNRRRCMEFIKSQQARLPLTLMICDIDHFKRINDRLGHLIGDRYLQTFSNQGRAIVEAAGGLFARYGGEEFVACLTDCSTARGSALAEELRQAMIDTGLRHDDGRPVTISIGVTVVEQEPLDIASLMQRADEALYRAKAAGRNRVIIAEAD